MDISLFKDLDRLNRTGNFSQAAELSHLSQSAFSRRIQSLERWVGAVLVDRSRQPVKLTAAGQQMLEAGLQAHSRIESVRSQILEMLSLPDRYVVTFGAQHSIGWRLFPTWLQAFEEAYGPILTRLRADDLPHCMRDLQKGNVDFVIAYSDAGADDRNRARLPAVERIVIGRDRLIPVCRPASDGTPIFDLQSRDIRTPFLQFGDAAPLGQLLLPLLQEIGLKDRLRTVYENSMAGALRIRARDGSGVAWLPESLILPDLSSGVLVRTGPAEWQVELSIDLHRIKEHSNRLTRAIWSFLEVRKSVYLV